MDTNKQTVKSQLLVSGRDFLSIGVCSLVGDVALAAVSHNLEDVMPLSLWLSNKFGARTTAGFHLLKHRAVPTHQTVPLNCQQFALGAH